MTIHDPIRGAVSRVLPGAYLPAEGEIELNAGRPITSLTFP
ncbi:hypothetical protein [Deinococcus daejeonensis]|nr:hypothetical protein [Deinococcus daejeonensis]